MLRSLAFALLAAAVLAPAAAAQNAVVETGVRTLYGTQPFDETSRNLLSGPFLAGDEVVWAEARSGARHVVAAGPAGRRVLLTSPEERTRFRLDVAEGRAVLTSYAIECDSPEDPDDPCGRYRGEYPRRFLLHAGPVSGTLAAVEGACPALGAQVTASALALACNDRAFTIFGDDGTTRSYEPGGTVAGEFLAHRQATAPLVVRRIASGEEVLRVAEAASSALDLAPDGTVVYALGGARIGWSSPAEPAVHPVDLPFAPSEARLGGERERIAVRGGAALAVVGRDGTVVATHAAATEGGFDFDGRRLAWIRRPCTTAEVVVWDLAQAPPAPGAACTAVAPAVRRVRADRFGRVRVRFACPARAPSACAGTVHGRPLFLPRGRRVGNLEDYDVDPGETVVLTFHVSVGALARARRAELGLRITVRGGRGRVVRLPLRLRR